MNLDGSDGVGESEDLIVFLGNLSKGTRLISDDSSELEYIVDIIAKNGDDLIISLENTDNRDLTGPKIIRGLTTDVLKNYTLID